MGSYRFYRLGADERSIEESERRCVDDLAALDVARSLCRDHPIEIWTDSRLVAHLNRADAEHTENQALSG